MKLQPASLKRSDLSSRSEAKAESGPRPVSPKQSEGGPDTMVMACKRYPVAKLKGLIPEKYLETLEHNQQIASCCRHPENHDIEAWKSRAEETAPDVYVFHCVCGRKHRRFCIGGGDVRPFWEIA